MYSLPKTLLQQRHLSVLVRRQCHKQTAGNGGADNTAKARAYFNKILDNPLPLGLGALVVGLLQLKRVRERESRQARDVEEISQAVSVDQCGDERGKPDKLGGQQRW